MTDKDLDSILKDALSSQEVPSELNEKLLKKIRKNKNAKIIPFARKASAVAAIFVCAVAVLSFYNSEVSPSVETLPEKKETLPSGGTISSAPAPAAEDNTAVSSEKAPVYKEEQSYKKAESHQEPAPASADIEPESEPIQADVAEALYDTAAVTFEEENSSEAVPQTFSRARTIPSPALSGLFEAGYDYKSAIKEKISAQISELPNAEEYNFSEIKDDIGFTLNEDNILTIIFPEGEIIAEEHGEQYFTVGKIMGGKLE